MFSTSSIELSRQALRKNLQFIRSLLAPSTRLCSVVKGNAYGHGLPEFVSMAMREGQEYFAVFSAEEAFTIRQALGISPRVYIMGMIEEPAFDWVLDQAIEVAVFDWHRLERLCAHAQEKSQRARIHIELETGMNRTGFAAKEWPRLAEYLNQHAESLEIIGISTHLAGAESLSNDFRVRQQLQVYQEGLSLFEKQGIRPHLRHAACSAALLNYPESQFDMVRIGILQYGFWPSQETYVRFSGERGATFNPLKRIIQWKSKVMSLKLVKRGEFIGYGTSFMAHKAMRLAVIPVGYSYGYTRSLSNIGKVLIHGKERPVIGTVNMNALTVDVSDLADLQEGEEVVLIGKQGKQTISVASFGELSAQMNYELLSRLPMNIPRSIVR
ncbi:alanine racemase [Cytophagales bacterium LB-30]|uniref:Alanine racemase n=1 Tax=Shiella aurantiaca TaxID=3058365 RepID=A0ABT8F6I9_9BACT|nr:alanine racemase [Shiella aurantiaca]MDN4166087.1 alanine racemase [Shiella aurantiaca]